MVSNFWSNYTGSDADGNSIGDTSHDIPGTANSQDRYPIWSEYIPGLIDLAKSSGGGGGGDKAEAISFGYYFIIPMFLGILLIFVVVKRKISRKSINK